MPITDEVRESNSPWIRLTSRRPNNQNKPTYLKGYDRLDKAIIRQNNEYIFIWDGTQLLTQFRINSPDFYKHIEWLDEEKLSRMVAELEANQKRIAELEGLIRLAHTRGWNDKTTGRDTWENFRYEHNL